MPIAVSDSGSSVLGTASQAIATNHFPVGVRLTTAEIARSLDGPVHHHLDLSQFCEDERSALLLRGDFQGETVAVLLKGHALITKPRFKARIAWFLPLGQAAEKSFKGQIHPFDDILECLGWHLSQFRAHPFARWQFATLIFIGEGDTSHAIGAFAFIQCRIVHLAAQAEPFLQRARLLARRIQPEQIRFGQLFGRCWLLSLRHASAARWTAR